MSTVSAVISRRAVKHNFALIQSLAPNSKIIVILKANAYGHGLLEMAQTLPDCDAIGVARLEEALALRAGGIVKPILLLEGFFKPSDIPILIANNLQTVIHSLEQIDSLEQVSCFETIDSLEQVSCFEKIDSLEQIKGLEQQAIPPGQLKVWLKVDTGMNRLGIAVEQFDVARERLNNIQYIAKPLNFMTHFACADDLDNPFTSEQSQQFYQLVQGLGGELTLANSAGILAWPNTHADWVRPGLLLYGCSPIEGRIGSDHGFIPAMTLSSSVIAIKSLAAGQKVGYGSAWAAPQDTTLAVVAIGYGDGYPRHAKAGTPVLINGKRYPIVGRVSMDMITVDLRDNPCGVRCGQQAIMWGPELPVEEIAQYAGTICYELILQLTSRVDIRFID